MKRCIKNLGRCCSVISVIILGMSMFALAYITWEKSQNTLETSLWLQSTEQQLKNQNEDYYNDLYDRYSRIHRDLNDYQYQTNKRLESLENRVSALETSMHESKTSPISVSQQVIGDRHEN